MARQIHDNKQLQRRKITETQNKKAITVGKINQLITFLTVVSFRMQLTKIEQKPVFFEYLPINSHILERRPALT
jgi:hypothetical protein